MDRRDFANRIKYMSMRRISYWMKELAFRLLNIYGGALFYILRLLKLLPLPLPLEKDKINKILIVRTDMIGDVVMATPFIKTVRENFPHAYIAMLVSELTKDIVMKNPYLNEVITVKGVGFRNLFRDLGTIKLIKEKKFDLAFIPFHALSCNFFVFLAGIPHRIGYGDRGSRFLLTKALNLAGFEQRREHMIDINLDLLRAIDCKIGSKELYVSIYEDSEERARILFQDNNLKSDDIVAMIHPGSSRPYQRWSVYKFALLADRLIDELKVKVIFLSGPLDSNLVEDTMNQIHNTAIVASGFVLRDVISLIKRCDLFIGHSTGTTHIADALGTLTIMIIGFLNSGDGPYTWSTSNKQSIMVFKDTGCKRCVPTDCRDYRCMVDISVQEVFEAAQKQIVKVKK